MGARIKASLESVLKLSVSERILAVEKIWDSIAEHPNALPITEAQRNELDRRLKDDSSSPQSLTWRQVKKRIQAKAIK